MSFFVGAALVAAAVILFILQPVVKGLHTSLVRAEDELTDTEARKRVALLALRDVEYDFLAGKLDEKDYRSLKSELTAEALAALEEDEAARALLARMSDSSDEEIEAEVARMRAQLKMGTTCSACGYANEDGSRFCSACGRPLLSPVAG